MREASSGKHIPRVVHENGRVRQQHSPPWEVCIVTRADTWFLQIFFWERFEGIAPKPVDCEKVEVVIGGLLKQRKSTPYIPIWTHIVVKQESNRSLVRGIDD